MALRTTVMLARALYRTSVLVGFVLTITGSIGCSSNGAQRFGASGSSAGGASPSAGSAGRSSGGAGGTAGVPEPSAGSGGSGGSGGTTDGGPTVNGPRIACVGDSITQGINADPYPQQLQALLGTDFQVENDGHSGTTLMKYEVFGGSYWDTSEFTRAHEFLPNVVIILLGTNDMGIYDWDHIADFEGDYAAMIDSFAGVTSKPRIFAGLPTWVYIPNTVTQLTEDKLTTVIIPAIERAASERGVELMDFHGLTQGHPEYYLEDGLHPNSTGYAAMAALVRDTLLK